MRVANDGLALRVEIGQNESAGATGKNVGTFRDSGNRTAITNHDLAAEGSGREWIETLACGIKSSAIGVDDRRRAITRGQAEAGHVTERPAAAVDIGQAIGNRATVRRGTRCRYPRTTVAIRRWARSGVASRGCDVDAGGRRVQEPDFNDVVIGIRAAGDRVVQRVDAVGQVSGINDDLLDRSNQGGARAGVDAYVVSNDARMGQYATDVAAE